MDSPNSYSWSSGLSDYMKLCQFKPKLQEPSEYSHLLFLFFHSIVAFLPFTNILQVSALAIST